MTALNSQPIMLREPLTLRGGGGRIVRGPRPTVTRLTMTALNSQPITLREPLTLRGGGGRIIRGPRPAVTRLTMTALNSQPITLWEPLTPRGVRIVERDRDRLRPMTTAAAICRGRTCQTDGQRERTAIGGNKLSAWLEGEHGTPSVTRPHTPLVTGTSPTHPTHPTARPTTRRPATNSQQRHYRRRVAGYAYSMTNAIRHCKTPESWPRYGGAAFCARRNCDFIVPGSLYDGCFGHTLS